MFTRNKDELSKDYILLGTNLEMALMFKWLLLIFCLINPLFYVDGMELRAAQEVCFQISGMILIMSGMMFQNRTKALTEKGLSISLFAFFAWAMMVFLKYNDGFPVILNLFIGFGVYLVTIKCLEKEDIVFVIKGLLWLAVYAIVYLALQYLNYDMRGQTSRSFGAVPHTSFFGLEACYGMYLAMVFILLLGISFINHIELDSRKTLSILKIFSVGIFLILLLTACWQSNSTGVFAGLTVGMLIYLWFQRRVFFWLLSAPMIICSLCFVLFYDCPQGMQGTRIDMWKKVITDSHREPFGHGLDSFRWNKDGAIRYFKYPFNNTTTRIMKQGNNLAFLDPVSNDLIEETRKNNGEIKLDWWDNAHNLFVQSIYEMGFPVIILMGSILYFLGVMFKQCRKTPLDTALFCSLVSIMICSLTQFPFNLARNGSLIPVVLGMFVISTREE